MNDLLDKLLIRIVLTILVCLMLLAYRYFHYIFYPKGKEQLSSSFSPINNNADTLHFFGRLIGIAILSSELGFYEQEGLIFTLLNFFLTGLFTFALYLISLYAMDSIVLFQFEHKEEIKRGNMAYALVSFAIALSIALIIRSIIVYSERSLFLLFLMWLFSIVLLGLLSSLYHFTSLINFREKLSQKSMSCALSFSGFLIGCTVIITSSLSEKHIAIETYGLQSFLKIILAALIFPLFRFGFRKIFQLNAKLENPEDIDTVGFGLFEGGSFLVSSLLTSIITGHIQFETIYPLF